MKGFKLDFLFQQLEFKTQHTLLKEPFFTRRKKVSNGGDIQISSQIDEHSFG